MIARMLLFFFISSPSLAVASKHVKRHARCAQFNKRQADFDWLNPQRQVIMCIVIITRQATRATHVRNRVCPRVELILKIIIILLIIFLGFIKTKPC